MQPSRFFALSSLSVIAFDAVASIASLVLGFPYSYAALGSAALYIVFAYFGARAMGFWAALLIVASLLLVAPIIESGTAGDTQFFQAVGTAEGGGI